MQQQLAPAALNLETLSRDAASPGQLASLLADRRTFREVWPWLRLVPTRALEGWVFGDGAGVVRACIRVGDPTYRGLVALLLERRLLDLAVRSRPRGLINFCRRLLLPHGAAGELADLWARADLPGAQADRDLGKQEAAFARRLEWVAGEVRPLLPWVADVARRVVAGRTPLTARADGLAVGVVFASTGGDALRPGALVRFRMLAEYDGTGPMVDPAAPFDAGFVSTLQEVRARLSRRFRAMDHKWDFLPEGSLRDTRCEFGVLTAQLLAECPRQEDRCWKLRISCHSPRSKSA